jgi:FkbM family methyltransferase
MDQPIYGTYAPSAIMARILRFTRSVPDSWASKRLMFLARRLALKLLAGKPVDMDTLGARMRLWPYNNVCEKRILFTPQLFDPQERAILQSHIKQGFVFLDIGANIGAYALFVAAKAGPKARILAIEPQPDIFDRLTYNIQQNPFGTIKAVACAIADKQGDLTLFLDSRNKGESSVKIVGASQSAHVRVPATTLMDLIHQEGFSHIDAIKLDVEGAEDLILEPFFRDAPTQLHPTLILVENGKGQWQIDLPTLLESHHYRLQLSTRLNLVYVKA